MPTIWTRKDLETVNGYTPGEQPKNRELIKLNTNENPYGPSPRVGETLSALSADSLRLYPDPVATQLRQKASEVYDVPPEWIIAGNGSDEVLAMLLRCAVSPGEKVLMVYPTYSLYPILAQIAGGAPESIDLREDQSLPESLAECRARVLFLANPNSPIGTVFPQEAIEGLCEKGDKIVAVDEAYADFAGVTSLPLLRKYENIVVFRTLSKSYSLAGVRLGLAFCRGEIREAMFKVKDSYNVNRITQELAIAALRDPEHMEQNVSKIVATRKRLRDALESLGFEVPQSGANFLFAKPPQGNARRIQNALREKGILVRFFNAHALDNGLRITIGTDDEIDRLIQTLKEIMAT